METDRPNYLFCSVNTIADKTFLKIVQILWIPSKSILSSIHPILETLYSDRGP